MTRMGCRVTVNQHGKLTFRFRWNRKDFWEGTSLNDSPDNHKVVEAQAVLISSEIKKRTFDYLSWFPEGNKAHLFKPKEEPEEEHKTMGEYYALWIERKKPPVVRMGLERDYRDHFRLYILPKFASVKLPEVTPPLLDAFRSYLTHEWVSPRTDKRKPLSLKTTRNVIDGSFRAMFRDARIFDQFDYLKDKDPFEVLMWPRLITPKPDPFTEEERDKILEHFRTKSPFYFPFASSI